MDMENTSIAAARKRLPSRLSARKPWSKDRKRECGFDCLNNGVTRRKRVVKRPLDVNRVSAGRQWAQQNVKSLGRRETPRGSRNEEYVVIGHGEREVARSGP